MRDAMRLLAVEGVAICFAAMGLAGCGQLESAEEESVADAVALVEEQDQRSPYDLIVGAQDDGAVDLPVRNGAGQSIVGLRFKRIDEAALSANLMAAGQIWAPDQTADVHFDGVAKEEGFESDRVEARENAVAEASATEEPLLLNGIYDLQFTMADGSLLSIHRLSLAALMGMEDIVVGYDEVSGLGYLTYIDGEGVEVSTLETERSIGDISAALAQAEAVE